MPRDRENLPWTSNEENKLIKLYEEYKFIEDKNEKYRKIAHHLHRGKTECWTKYKELSKVYLYLKIYLDYW